MSKRGANLTFLSFIGTGKDPEGFEKIKLNDEIGKTKLFVYITRQF